MFVTWVVPKTAQRPPTPSPAQIKESARAVPSVLYQYSVGIPGDPLTPSRSTEIPWGSPGGPPEGHLANPWKFSGGTHGHPWITSGDPLKAWKVPIGIPSRNVAGTRIPGFQRLPRVFPLGKTLGKSSGSPPHFSSGVSPGGKTGGLLYPWFSPGVSPGGLSTYPGFSPCFSSGVSSGGKPWVFTPGFP